MDPLLAQAVADEFVAAVGFGLTAGSILYGAIFGIRAILSLLDGWR